MRNFLRKIHGLPEEGRKLLAGLCMAVAGIAFFGLWTSFVSSRLVALAPSPASAPAAQGAVGVSDVAQTAPASESGALSPAEGIADTLRGFQNAVSGSAPPQGFFASVGQGLTAVAEAIYMKLAPWVPPYL